MSAFFCEMCEIRDRALALNPIEPSEEWQNKFRATLREHAGNTNMERMRIFKVQDVTGQLPACTDAQLERYVRRLRGEGFHVTKDDNGAYWIYFPETPK